MGPGNSECVLVGTTTGDIHRTCGGSAADASTSWPAARPRQGRVSSVTFHPADAAVAYATYSWFGGTHVWKTTNGGATWTALDGSGIGKLPDVPVHWLIVDPTRSARLYSGTDVGVFTSLDGGLSWAVENTGFATSSPSRC